MSERTIKYNTKITTSKQSKGARAMSATNSSAATEKKNEPKNQRMTATATKAMQFHKKSEAYWDQRSLMGMNRGTPLGGGFRNFDRGCSYNTLEIKVL